MSVPSSMKAVVIEGKWVKIAEQLPIPQLFPSEVLVRTRAVAGNPTDWGHVAYGIGPQGGILGCDVAGDIVALGLEVDARRFKVGMTVYGFAHGASVRRPTNGAFAEYVALDSNLAYVPADGTLPAADSSAGALPAGVVNTVEGAVTLPVSLTTAGMVLNREFGLDMAWHPARAQRDYPVLFWGGATAVGQLLIQLAKHYNGYSKIIAVASKKHEAKLKAYGADEVFDYHDADVIAQITSKYPNFRNLVDCVSTATTIQQVYQCAARDGSDATVCQLRTLTINDIPAEHRRDNVKVIGTLLYSVGGVDVPFGPITIPADPTYRQQAIDFIKFITPKVNNGEIEHIPVKIYRNGLQSVPQITDDIKNNRVSGEKLVASFA